MSIETVPAGQLLIDSRGKITLKPAVIVPPAEKKLTAATEDEVWEECKQRLKQHGFYRVAKPSLAPMKSVHGYYLSTQQKRRSKVSEGLSDVYIAIAGVPIWFPLELKSRELRADGTLRKPTLSAEQRVLHKAGCISIIQSAADVDHVIENLRKIFAHEQIVRMFQHAANVPSSQKS